jgi:hypothetical protein
MSISSAKAIVLCPTLWGINGARMIIGTRASNSQFEPTIFGVVGGVREEGCHLVVGY